MFLPSGRSRRPVSEDPVTAGSGATGKLGTIKRPGGALQATYNGHPLYTYRADTAPGQANGNGVNASGGVWHEVTTSGRPRPPRPLAGAAMGTDHTRLGSAAARPGNLSLNGGLWHEVTISGGDSTS